MQHNELLGTDQMSVKYIVALLANNPKIYIDYVQTNLLAVASEYMLSDSSAPHITLAQFFGTEQEYQDICIYLEEQNIRIPVLEFTGIAILKKNDFWWVEYSLMKTQSLLALQKKVADFLQQRNLTLLNHSGDLYRPHLTLARINTTAVSISLQTIIPQSSFSLAIGEADSLGQFVKVRKEFRKPL